MAYPKVTIIGAGSPFTFHVISDMIRRSSFRHSAISLVDTDPNALEASHAIARRMVSKAGSDIQLDRTTDREEALEDSHFVLVTISVGEPWAREEDVAIGERFGIYQPTSQTVGPAGFMRGLRVIPHVVAIARDVSKICPEATIINVTNPMAAVCRAMIREAGVTVLGICEAWRLTYEVFASLLEIPAAELDCLSVGTNHFTWALKLHCHGEDVLPEFLSRLETKKGRDLLERMPISKEVYETYELWPTGSDLHTAEFFSHFLTKETNGGAAYGLSTRHTTKRQYEHRLETRRKQAEGSLPIDNLLKPSQEGVVEVMEGIQNDSSSGAFIVNIPNNGSIEGLSNEAIVELPATVNSSQFRGVRIGPFPQPVGQFIANRTVQQEILVDAAIAGDRKLAVRGMLLDEQIRSPKEAHAILEESIFVNKRFYPQFR